MIKIEISAAARTLHSKKSNRDFRVQEAYAFTLDQHGKPHPHPTRVEFFLNDSDPQPQPGTYLLAPGSIYVDRTGHFGIAPKLVPVAK